MNLATGNWKLKYTIQTFGNKNKKEENKMRKLKLQEFQEEIVKDLKLKESRPLYKIVIPTSFDTGEQIFTANVTAESHLEKQEAETNLALYRKEEPNARIEKMSRDEVNGGRI